MYRKCSNLFLLGVSLPTAAALGDQYKQKYRPHEAHPAPEPQHAPCSEKSLAKCTKSEFHAIFPVIEAPEQQRPHQSDAIQCWANSPLSLTQYCDHLPDRPLGQLLPRGHAHLCLQAGDGKPYYNRRNITVFFPALFLP